jgi:regulator of sirC expression with transglutaminase-like and TPR domain
MKWAETNKKMNNQHRSITIWGIFLIIFIFAACKEKQIAVHESYHSLIQSFSNDAVEKGIFDKNDIEMKSLIKFVDQTSTQIKKTEDDNQKINKLLTAIYDDQKIEFEKSFSDFEGMMPQLVFKKKKGRCLGIGLIMLLIAEKADLPLYGISIPEHFFLRYDNESNICRNIEPNRNGIEHPDSYYKKQYNIQYNHHYSFKNLTPLQVTGLLYYNTGNHKMKEGDLQKAKYFFNKAKNLFPSMPQTYGNLAILFARQKKYDKARKMFDKCHKTDPYLQNLYINYGMFEESRNNLKKALHIYQDGLKLYSNDPTLKQKAEKVQFLIQNKR